MPIKKRQYNDWSIHTYAYISNLQPFSTFTDNRDKQNIACNSTKTRPILNDDNFNAHKSYTFISYGQTENSGIQIYFIPF